MNPKYQATNDAYNAIKELILNCDLQPGQKINQDELGESLGLSRTPIRRALDMLAVDNLVEVTPHKGACVTDIDPAYVNDLYEIRAQIEAMAAIQAVFKVKPEEIDELYKMVETQDKMHLIDPLPSNELIAHNRIFHRKLVAISRNRVLVHQFENLWDQTERCRRLYYRTLRSTSDPTRISDHQIIIDLLVKGDPQECADFALYHTRKTQIKLLYAMNSEARAVPYKPVYLDKILDTKNPYTGK